MRTLFLPVAALLALAVPALADAQITVTHGKVPDPTYIDLGPAGNSVGDERIWHFDGKTTDGQAVVMDWIMTTTGMPGASSGLESRMTSAVFSIGGGADDHILVEGVGLYPPAGSTAKVDATLTRAIIGGTGKYAGAKGTAVSTHLSDGTWQHVLNIP